jgi:hypothetical protein
MGKERPLPNLQESTSGPRHVPDQSPTLLQHISLRPIFNNILSSKLSSVLFPTGDSD